MCKTNKNWVYDNAKHLDDGEGERNFEKSVQSEIRVMKKSWSHLIVSKETLISSQTLPTIHRHSKKAKKNDETKALTYPKHILDMR